MPVKIVASQRIGPIRIRRARGGTTSVTLRIGPLAWAWRPTKTTAPRPRLTATQRQVLAERTARRAVRARAVLADLLAVVLIVSAVRGAPPSVLVVLALADLAAVAAWWRRRRSLHTPEPTESEED